MAPMWGDTFELLTYYNDGSSQLLTPPYGQECMGELAECTVDKCLGLCMMGEGPPSLTPAASLATLTEISTPAHWHE